MSDKADKDDKPKGKGKMGLILVAVAMLVVGGGGAAGAMMFMGGDHSESHEPKGPQLVRKGEVDPYAPPAGEGEEEGGGGHEEHGDGGDEYRTAYYTFKDEFTSNLKDSDALVQLALACSTRRDGRVLQWLAKHELAIRSNMLSVIADTHEDDMYTIKGKDKLQKRLTKTINDVLTKKEGYGGVDAVYFRTLIIQ
ncbi:MULTISPECIES: flagellar basal body-associated FliL family protein [Novosphingobium]|uniref:Flagellar protein FliL n=1 Tax=Novosphingobium decolorationis TaxID=2698673 RepID=A0ABX8E8F6_9SPHN|nr:MULTISPECIES: flagellar basal body-associated FliL family protein [Novosphingobium]MED5544379.1 flagellar basal body-associated FliL family protein [Pseudomonadota bacterium]QVM85344.1 flagellar basal body-associated FliL family protein [Novosphingobium decolorationis]GAM03412.1 flagellar FliL protein [Novosphingobium sp. MBES04]